ncbi:hypothetical protein Pmani_002500 [Petrolisthes manimaculis]|uniref:Endonuclease/exonuclease/phosphatase domain-containing protein n=1 Tax=Petrolisthes manimaculis TaxID=1843537 RepID=A0AAE1QHI6_9EUCA|nr:hypothetical protein Pmani_002500 [Petrolisthes manimaculis]
MEGGVAWTGMDEKSKGRGKEGCALLVSGRVWKGIDGHGRKGTRIVWMTGKIGIVKYAWVCAYAPVNAQTKVGKEKMREFWNDLIDCLRIFESGRRIVMIGDMNGKVGNEKRGSVVGKWGVNGINENGECLVDLCAEAGLFLANTCFEHKLIHRYTWKRRDERGEQMSLIDYVAVDERLRKDVLDARVVRGMFQCSDHYAVLARIRVRAKWEYGRKDRGGNEREVANGRLNDVEYGEVYKRRVGEMLEDARLSMGEGVGVNDAYEMFKNIVMKTAAGVVGYKAQKRGKKGSAWWTEEMKDAVDEKRKAYRRTLQRNVSEEVRERWKRDYNACKRQVKRMVSESKRRVDEEFGRKLSEKFRENKKLFWKEVKKERGEGKSGSVRMKREDGVTVSRSEEVKEVWKRHFDGLMNEGTGGEAVVTCMGMEAGSRRQDAQGELGREEIRKAIGKLKMGKAPGVDGITAEMLKYGGEVVVEWMLLIIMYIGLEAGRGARGLEEGYYCTVV